MVSNNGRRADDFFHTWAPLQLPHAEKLQSQIDPQPTANFISNRCQTCPQKFPSQSPKFPKPIPKQWSKSRIRRCRNLCMMTKIVFFLISYYVSYNTPPPSAVAKVLKLGGNIKGPEIWSFIVITFFFCFFREIFNNKLQNKSQVMYFLKL